MCTHTLTTHACGHKWNVIRSTPDCPDLLLHTGENKPPIIESKATPCRRCREDENVKTSAEFRCMLLDLYGLDVNELREEGYEADSNSISDADSVHGSDWDSDCGEDYLGSWLESESESERESVDSEEGQRVEKDGRLDKDDEPCIHFDSRLMSPVLDGPEFSITNAIKGSGPIDRV